MTRDVSRVWGCAALCTTICLGLGAASVAIAAPVASSQSANPGLSPTKAAKKVGAVRHKKARGASKWETSLPTRVERNRGAGVGLVVAETPWAKVSVRQPFATTRTDDTYTDSGSADRAALAFNDADVVDARSGWAQWRGGNGGLDLGQPGSSGSGQPPPGDLPCILMGIDCDDDGDASDVDMHLWVNAKASEFYLVVCRVKFEDEAGQITVVPGGSTTLSIESEHQGEATGSVAFVLDPQSTGWYGVEISSGETWWTTGCTIDIV